MFNKKNEGLELSGLGHMLGQALRDGLIEPSTARKIFLANLMKSKYAKEVNLNVSKKN